MKNLVLAVMMLAGFSAAAKAGIVPEELQARAAIAAQLTVNQPDNSVQVVSLKISPTILGYVSSFEAVTEEIGFAGIAQRFTVRGTYNSVTNKVAVMERSLLQSAREMGADSSVRAALKKLLECNMPDRSVQVVALTVEPTYMGYLYSFRAEVVETGFTGIPVKRTLTGLYNTVTNKVSEVK